MEPGEAYLSLLDGLRGTVDSDTEPRRLVDRAAGLLAGRVGCPVREAQSHLLRIAEEQERDPAEVAADVLAILDAPASPGGASRVRAVVQDALRPRPADVFGVPDDREPPLRPGTVQEIVHGLPGAHSWLVPVRDEAGGVLAFVTPAARQEERIAQTERLGNLGWGEWDLVTGHVVWSAGLYRIYERNPADGPLSTDAASELILPEDQPLRIQAMTAFAAGDTADVTFRIRVGERVKHVRSVVDAVRDATGRPLKIYGIVQDVTARETARVRLADVERQLHEHQRTLAAEHRMAMRLQQIILPIPDAPVDLPGLRVAVRYLPAERASQVGGDWFHAAEVAGGGVLLAVGDVAGHGIQAATTMAQLRHALAALAVTTTSDPAALLGHLNHLLCAGGVAADTATVVIARYQPDSHTLTWALAGHPAPLRTRDGVTTELPRPRGPLLGVLADAEYENASISFEPGDLLVLYTDGLVENRTQGLGDGLAPVIATLNRITAAGSPQPLADPLGRF